MRQSLGLIAIVFVGGVTVGAFADKPREFQRRWTRMVYVEDTLRDLEAILGRLELSVLDLRLPASSTAMSLFRRDVELMDVTSNSIQDSTLSTQEITWDIAARQVSRREQLRIWDELFRAVSYFKHANFQFVDGRYLDGQRDTFLAHVKFSGLARQHDQMLCYVSSDLDITFDRVDEATDQWRIVGWKTISFQTSLRHESMFRDELASRVPNGLYATLRRCPHEERSAELIADKLAGGRATKMPFRTFDVTSWTRHPGLSVVDFDSDGFDDLFVTRRTGRNFLLRNRGNGTFEDATKQAGLTSDMHVPGFTNGALFGDFDNDGDADVFVARSLYRARYYRNEGGHFTFSPHAIDVPLPAHVVSISAADFDNDGLLDVYLSRYMPETNGFNMEITGNKKRDVLAQLYESNRSRLANAENREFARRTWKSQTDLFRDAPGLPNILLKNVGDGRFEVAKEGKELQVWRPTYQATWTDYDADGDADVYLANDFAPNCLFRNDDGVFTDVTSETGTADAGFGMGASWGDYDGDGQFDLYVTNMFSKAGRRITQRMGRYGADFVPLAAGNTLFRQTKGTFHQASTLQYPVATAGWGWGSQLFDADNDGDLDIYAPAGYYTAPPSVRIPIDT